MENATGHAADKIKNEVKNGLTITVNTNLKSVNHLEVSLNLKMQQTKPNDMSTKQPTIHQ